ncbi:7834_t:CDS:2, partial [Cetraspora pellucida]
MDYLRDLNPQQKQAVLELHPRQAQPQNILILTFAKKAIKEIKKRIFDQVASVAKKDLHIYNFHSFCFHVLSQHSYLLGFPASKFPVYARHEQEEVVRKIVRQINYNHEQKEINTIISCIEYQEYLQANKALDFNDLLIYTIRLFRQHPSVREEYQRQFTHILLDEFQDINAT